MTEQFTRRYSTQQVSNNDTCERLINEMEREQESMVVRLLREINELKLENSYLKQELQSFRDRREGSYTSIPSPPQSRNTSVFDSYSISSNSSLYEPSLPRSKRSSLLLENLTTHQLDEPLPINTHASNMALYKKRGSFPGLHNQSNNPNNYNETPISTNNQNYSYSPSENLSKDINNNNNNNNQHNNHTSVDPLRKVVIPVHRRSSYLDCTLDGFPATSGYLQHADLNKKLQQYTIQ
ncbi:hypothetical protein Kpol_1026p23 [Vanderwaltozyma polyspora DSM 70294]|uniref:Uncharacterized protein n=1 Tax=Vanderwaltozyma polyspora (strain ATCC 22028 / DSM 70294 / BCRC 21397 / CBS 2163 / NBRC 10782 / NRRL Y-8283 / UCD 57-17) TaxID=436907 RepID=A7TNJ2_VANPO|nr:uncharacterized protein Kpol_1026p23 [Vanderwaltozyma polyspora DSM 70294]EDO16175.1 hypothetical protein Kpol_1026p23 [Vanderwaltozyma polyspora DSM 70294]